MFTTYSLHCSFFLGLPFRILNIDLLKPEKGTTMETIGSWCPCAMLSHVVLAQGLPWLEGSSLSMDAIGCYGPVGATVLFAISVFRVIFFFKKR